jgi:hypothetical protein
MMTKAALAPLRLDPRGGEAGLGRGRAEHGGERAGQRDGGSRLQLAQGRHLSARLGEPQDHRGVAFAGGREAVVDRADHQQPGQHQRQQPRHGEQQSLLA